MIPSSADVYLKRSTDRVGHVYEKTTYFEYSDVTFTKEILKRPVLGILGPTLHAEVGDTLEVTYFNNASRTLSLHPHGVFYLKDGEGRSPEGIVSLKKQEVENSLMNHYIIKTLHLDVFVKLCFYYISRKGVGEGSMNNKDAVWV